PTTPQISTLSLHDALPICEIATNIDTRSASEDDGYSAVQRGDGRRIPAGPVPSGQIVRIGVPACICKLAPDIQIHPIDKDGIDRDRKSTRLNSSHVEISYA